MELTKLHPVTHSRALGINHYCGPSAISIITGRSTGCASRWILRSRGYDGWGPNGGVKGTHPREIAAALNGLGYSVRRIEHYHKGNRPTFNNWIRNRSRKMLSQAFLVNVGNHWVVVLGSRMFDSKAPHGTFVTQAHGQKARVSGVHHITLTPGPEALQIRRQADEPMPEGYLVRKPKRPRGPTLATLKARCRRLALRVEDDGSEIRVHAPKGRVIEPDHLHEMLAVYDGNPHEKKEAIRDLLGRVRFPTKCKDPECDYCTS